MPNIIPQEALNYLGNKKLTVGFDHGDVWKAEHNSSFTVAKMMKLDLLADTREALEQALREGKTFKQFAEQLKPQLIKKGWWGQQTAIDPLDDSEKLVQLGSNARLKTIYQTNMRTARGAGQWERIERNKETHPYLLYELGPSREHREDHVKWNNLLLPIDDPFWQTHYTPNGWGCKCRVRSVSENEATQLTQTGINKKQQELDDNGLPTGRFTSETSAVKLTSPTIKTRQFVNKRTGEVEQVPEGIDPGWNYHPGTRLAKLANNAMAKGIDAEPMTASIAITDLMKVEAISGEVGKVFAQGVDDAVKQIAAGKAIPRGTTWHLGAIQPEVVAALKSENVLLNSSIISIQDADLFHMLRGHKAIRQSQGKVVDKRLPVSFLQQLPEQLLTPKAIVRDLQQKTPTLLYVYQLEENGKKVTLKLNYEIKVNKEKIKTNLIRSGEIVDDINTLKASKVYQLIWGEL